MSGERDLASVRRNITGWTEYDGVDGNASGDGVGNGVSPNIHPPLKVVTSRHCCRLERDIVKFRRPDVSCRSGVFPIKFRD
jgi:hypothetical protein